MATLRISPVIPSRFKPGAGIGRRDRQTPPRPSARQSLSPLAASAPQGAGCPEPSSSRRAALGLLAAVPILPALAEEPVIESAPAAPALELSPTASRGEVYKTKYYSYYVPRGWEPEAMGDADQATPSIESKFVAPDGKQSVTVTYFQASTVKPTFLQIQDIADWGGPNEVFLLLNLASRLLGTTTKVIPGVERDTGTIRGVVKSPDTTVYTYQLLNSKDQRITLAVAARGGKVFKARCAAPLDLWDGDEAVQKAVTEIADSFSLA